MSAGRDPDTSSALRLRRLHLFRFALVAVGFALLGLAAEGGDQRSRLPYVLLAGLGVVNLGYMGVAWRTRATWVQAAFEIALDGVVITVLVYLTGGLYSFAAILYYGGIVAAALLVSSRAAFLLASSASVALAVTQTIYYLAAEGLIVAPLVSEYVLHVHTLHVQREAAQLIAQGVALHAVAGLASWLTRELGHVRILYSEILEHMAEGLIAVDSASRIVFVNAEAREMLGYGNQTPLKGQLLHTVFRREEDRAILSGLSSQSPTVTEIELTTPEGVRTVQVKTALVRHPSGRSRGVIAILTDLTLHRQIEQADRQTARLEELQRLALAIAHEIRNPLASIRGCVQELGRSAHTGADEQKLVEIVCRESDRLDAIVHDFMRFARIRAPERRCRLDLSPLLRDVAVLLDKRVPAVGAKLTLDQPESAWVCGDPGQLSQVFLNLGVNALQAMASGGELTVRVREVRLRVPRTAFVAQGRERTIDEVAGFEIQFQDDGCGIPSEHLDQVFVPLFTTKTEGSGLGLSIAERIVEAHDGEIVIRSRVGVGTTVCVRIPAGTNPPEQISTEPGSPTVEGAAV